MFKWEGQGTPRIAAPFQNVSLHPYHSPVKNFGTFLNKLQLLISLSADAIVAETWEAAALSRCCELLPVGGTAPVRAVGTSPACGLGQAAQHAVWMGL